jgi:hypothetical protein
MWVRHQQLHQQRSALWQIAGAHSALSDERQGKEPARAMVVCATAGPGYASDGWRGVLLRLLQLRLQSPTPQGAGHRAFLLHYRSPSTASSNIDGGISLSCCQDQVTFLPEELL